MPPILYLIDGHALAYRTYFALTSSSGDRFKTHSGEPTAGIYGFASVLLSMLEHDKPEYLAVAFDTGKTFRDELFPEYKATREKMPDDLRPQMDRIRQMVDAFHIPRLEAKGFEADDVLGSIARQAVDKGLGVKILTGDRDLLQLVDDRVTVRLAGSKLSEAPDCTFKQVLEIFGVPPEKVIEYKALVGDASDNIPGVAGVGDKTALALLQQFNNLEEIYANLDKVPARVRTKLEQGKEMAFLSRNLATIRTNVEIVLDLEQANTQHLDFARLEAFFVELEFRTLIARLHTLARKAPAFGVGPQLALFGQEVVQVGTPSTYELNVVVVNSPAGLAELKTRLASASKISFDTETTSTDVMRADLVGISLAVKGITSLLAITAVSSCRWVMYSKRCERR
jgi:DNA polymerase-1